MAIRLQSEFRTLNDDQYRIKIFDSAYLGNPVDVNVGGDGFTLTHDGETDAVYSPIVGSSVTLTIYNNDSAIDSFRTALLNAQDKQFSLRIEKWNKPESRDVVDNYRNRVIADGGTYEGGDCVNDALFALGVGSESRTYVWQQSNESRVIADGGTYEGGLCVIDAIDALGGSTTIPDSEFDLYWTGYIAQDLIEEADESKPRAVSLRAADGISIISTIDYQFGLAQSFSKTFKDIVVEILTDANINDLFESDETMLTSVVNWYAEEHTYSSTMDPMDNIKTDLKAYTSWTSGSARQYTNALQVIREIATITNSRFYFDDGSFRFEQISERDNINVREFYYLNNGTSNGNAVVQLDTLIDQDTAHRSNGTFRYLPAVKKVSLTQQKKSAANIIGGTVTFPADEIDVGVVPSADNGHIILEMLSRFQTFVATPVSGTATPIFDVTIRLEPSDGTANQYWRNALISGVTSFGVGFWSTTFGAFKWAANTVSRQTSSTVLTQYAMATGPLPKDGEVYIDITILGFYDAQGSATSFFTGGNSFNWAVDLQKARFENDNESATVVESIFEANNTSTALGSNITVDLGATRLGDGAGAIGSLYAYNGSTWTPSTGWRVGNSGTYIDIAKLATRETLGLQSRVVHRYEGTIINGGAFKKRLRFDSLYWLPMRSTLTANTDEFNVEAFKIARVIETVDISSDPIEIGDDTAVVAVADFSGMYANFGSGVISNMAIDADNDAIGPFSETATGGKITGTAAITGATTMPSAQLTGGAGSQGTMEWNGDEDTISLVMNGTTHFIGQDVVYNVKNQTGALIGKGTPVMASGTLGSSGRILITPSVATGEIPARFYLGVTAEDIADGADGKVIEFGKIRQFDTSAFTDGDVLWLDPANNGRFTKMEPAAPNLKIATALVIDADANGTIMVRANQGHKLADAHDVEIVSPADNDVLKYDASTGVWRNEPLT